MQILNNLNFLTPLFPHCKSPLLYADDTLLFLKPSTDQISRVKLLFAIFEHTSGLKINISKSELAVTSAPLSLTQNLADIIQCKPLPCPINYLGLPLSDRNLTRADYLPLFDRIQSSLAGWTAPLLSIGGRLILTNSVMTAIPQYFMSIFLLPKWVLRKIDQIRKKFFWHGHREQRSQDKVLYMVNWALATRPRELGGLGIRDIQITNQTLLMKWMWQWLHTPNAWWKEVTILYSPSDRPWNANNALHFWKSMKHIAPPFHSSILFQVGNGTNTKFWHDNWRGTPFKFLFPNLFQAVQDKEISVAQSHETGSLLQPMLLSTLAQLEKEQLMLSLQDFQPTQLCDEVKWLRHSTSFSVKSAYKFISFSPSPISLLSNIWKIKALLKIQIFTWLLLNNRLATIDNLVRRGWYLPNMCIMCKRNEESADHLFQKCHLAKEIRSHIQAVFADRYLIPRKFSTESSMEIIVDPTENECARQWEVTTCFILWRERCRQIFSKKELQSTSLVKEICLEWKNWFTDFLSQSLYDPG